MWKIPKTFTLSSFQKMALSFKDDTKLPIRDTHFVDAQEFLLFMLDETKARAPEAYQDLDYALRAVPANEKTGMVLSFFQMYNWLVYSMPAFKLEKGVFSGFALTDAKDVTDIQLPFPSFLIETPRDFWLVEAFHTGQQVPMSLIKVNSYAVPEWEAQHGETNAIRYTILFEDGTEIYNAVPYSVFLSGQDSYDRNIIEEERIKIDAARNVILNMCVFLDSNKDDVKRVTTPAALRRKAAKKRRRKKRGRAQAKPIIPKTWAVGRKVKVGRETVEAAMSLASPRTWQLKSQFTVRGHWRNQPYGPGRKKTKKLWIKPHWKGPKGAQRLSHLYEVDED